ncbi:MAG: SRPBCC family protein [Bacteroidota bacterium]|nr:SRPBCC family protein [Bacteroidota bacterium]
MNILIIILLVIGGLIALLLLIALFIKKEYTVFREVIINKPKQDVFNYIRFLKNQDKYSIWVMQDPELRKTFSGIDGTKGFIYKWEGNKAAGAGEQEIMNLREGEQVDVEVRFLKPFVGTAKAPMSLASMGKESTKVTWGMIGKSKFPMSFMNLFMDSMIGNPLQKSLENLKAILEKNG